MMRNRVLWLMCGVLGAGLVFAAQGTARAGGEVERDRRDRGG